MLEATRARKRHWRIECNSISINRRLQCVQLPPRLQPLNQTLLLVVLAARSFKRKDGQYRTAYGLRPVTDH